MRFTGQQGDATGLLYMNARYYDPQLGQFISPDTLVPDATNLFDYNRYMYARGNPMKYNDPTGHCADGIVNPIHFLHSPCELGGPEAAAEAEMASAVENAATAAQAETAASAEAATPLADAVNASDGAVVYDATPLSGIGESGIAGETTVVIEVNPTNSGSVQEPKGGTYLLRDPNTDQIMRTGRTNDLERREIEHRRNPSTSDLNFEVDTRTDDYAAQRGREQLIHEQYNPPLNRINPVSPRNPNLPRYLEAGRALYP